MPPPLRLSHYIRQDGDTLTLQDVVLIFITVISTLGVILLPNISCIRYPPLPLSAVKKTRYVKELC